MQKRTEGQWLLDHSMIRSVMVHNRSAGQGKIYLFLDFDGVVNVFAPPGSERYEQAEKTGHFDFFDRDCVARLNAFAADYPVSIVISSSWRYGGLVYCREYLKEAGLGSHVVFCDTTSLEADEPREDLIMDYLLAHQDFAGFLIFDDIHMTHLLDYLVQTDPMKGWDEACDQKARKIIKKFVDFLK